jgi:ribosomal-protein-alanine N-acetyltransferase
MIAPTEDIDRIMAVMETAFDPLYGEAWNRRQVEDALLTGTCHYFLANRNGNAAGNDEPASGFFLSRVGIDEEELLLIAVEPGSRCTGIGRKLIEYLFNSARLRGTSRIFLEMRKNNPAEKLYRKVGFRPIGLRKNYYHQRDGQLIDAITFEFII